MFECTFMLIFLFPSFQCLAQVNKETESVKLKRCASSEQGNNLLATYGDKSARVQRPLAFVPTVIINEVCSISLFIFYLLSAASLANSPSL